MKIVPTTQTIGQFFYTENEHFFVPPYQRRYAWGTPQLEALFNDINLLKENDTHLLGTVVLLVGPYSAGVNSIELVDGQQRITTLCILFKTLQRKLKENASGDERREIKKYLTCKSSSGDERRKIMLGDLDCKDFEKIMEKEECSEIENEKLKQAVEFFNEKFDELGPDITKFYRKLINQTELIRLDIGYSKDAYRLFEIINNRGLRLGPADIIKNFLLGHASLLGDSILEKIKDDWRSIILDLDSLPPANMDRFFRQYLMGKIKLKITRTKLSEEFKNYYYLNVREAEKLSDYESRIRLMGKKKAKKIFASEIEEYDDDNEDDEIIVFDQRKYKEKKVGIEEFAKDLRESASIYKSLVLAKDTEPKITHKLEALKKIEALPAYTFLMSIRQRGIDNENFAKILNLIEVFILRRQICEYRTGELDDIFSKLCELPKKNLLENVRNELEEETPRDEEFLEKFVHFTHKGSDERSKHILSKIEYHLAGNYGEIDIKGGKDVHLEHIVPQNISPRKTKKESGGDWLKYLGKDKNKIKALHKKNINRIGNLTIIAQILNIKASNNPFKSKLNEYRKSIFLLNKNIVEEYNNFKFPQIEKRSRWLAEIAVKIWKF